MPATSGASGHDHEEVDLLALQNAINRRVVRDSSGNEFGPLAAMTAYCGAPHPQFVVISGEAAICQGEAHVRGRRAEPRRRG